MIEPPEHERWVRVTEVFDRVRLALATEQPALLQQLAGEDCALRDEVRQLLDHHHDDAFLQPRARITLEHTPPPLRSIGDIVGAYRIEREIGRGGMGVVYEASHVDATFERRVAIKMLPVGTLHPELLWRFRREQQILSRLEHPNIASLFDGGTTIDGVPFLVMELVEGVRIDTWCDQRGLSITQRLDVFRQLCTAVQFAHSKLIVHRDLKPGNILITRDGVVKLLDFGIAKLLAPEVNTHDLTELGIAPRTAAFASPEQLRGDAATTSSDVYSLGVLLYRLLTGNAPVNLDGKSPADVEQLMATQPPRLPSENVTDAHARAAGARDTRVVQATLRGELDAILLMALRHDPARRYGSVDAMSADISRYLNGEPVHARPERLTYVLRSLVRRHKALATASALTAVVLLIATAVSLRSAQVARAEAQRANRMAQALENILGAADPFAPDGLRLHSSEISLRQVLDSARIRVARTLADEPRTRADIYRALGNSYRNLDELDFSRTMLDSAIRLHTEVLGARSAQVRYDRISSAQLDMARGDADRSLSELHALRATYASEKLPGDSGLVEVLVALGGLKLSVFLNADGVADMMREALALERASARPRTALLSLAEAVLALAHAQTGNAAVSDSLILTATERLVPDSLRSPAELVYVLAYTGLAKYMRGQSVDAERIWRRSHGLAVQVFGPLHPLTAETQSGLSWVLLDRAQHTEGRALIDSALAVETRRPWKNHGVMSSIYRLQMAYAIARADAATAATARRLAERELALSGGQRPYLLVQLLWLTAALDVATAHADSASFHLEQASQIAANEIGPTHPFSRIAASRAAEFAKRMNARRP